MGNVSLTSTVANELGTLDGCAVEILSFPGSSLAEISLDFANNFLMVEPAATIDYTTVNDKPAARLQGYKQVGFSAAPVAVQIIYENEKRYVVFCATVEFDPEILLIMNTFIVL